MHFYHDTHFKRKFRLEIARLTIFKGIEGQFTTLQTAMGPEDNLHWRFHSLSGPRLMNEAPPSQPRLRLKFAVAISFLLQRWHNKKKVYQNPEIKKFYV